MDKEFFKNKLSKLKSLDLSHNNLILANLDATVEFLKLMVKIENFNFSNNPLFSEQILAEYTEIEEKADGFIKIKCLNLSNTDLGKMKRTTDFWFKFVDL